MGRAARFDLLHTESEKGKIIIVQFLFVYLANRIYFKSIEGHKMKLLAFRIENFRSIVDIVIVGQEPSTPASK